MRARVFSCVAAILIQPILGTQSSARPIGYSFPRTPQQAINPDRKNSQDLVLANDGRETVLRIVNVGKDVVFEARKMAGRLSIKIFNPKTKYGSISSKFVSAPEIGLKLASLKETNGDLILDVTPTDQQKDYPWDPKNQVSTSGNDLLVRLFSNSPDNSLFEQDRTSTNSIYQDYDRLQRKPRAIAPPLGDMASSAMLIDNRSFIEIEGPPVTLTLKGASTIDSLTSIARLGGYGIVFVPATSGAVAETSDITKSELKISLQLVNEPYARAFNSVLLASGLQAKVDKKLILVGNEVESKIFGPTLSKNIRLNQVAATSAADYLASLGALINKVKTTSQVSTLLDTDLKILAPPLSPKNLLERTALTSVESYTASSGPLKGVIGTIDPRLQTITLVGSPELVRLAEDYLRRIDLRQRQVALKVKIVDINLDSLSESDNSFLFRWGNNVIVNSRGVLSGTFNYNVQGSTMPSPFSGVSPVLKNIFYDTVNASIDTNNAKLLASPTLVLSENSDRIEDGDSVSAAPQDALNAPTIGRKRANESFITVGTSVVTNWKVIVGQNGSPNTCEAELDVAGLTLGAKVHRIDDNGFVTFTVSPAVSAVTSIMNNPSCGQANVLSVRRLDTGSARVRDGDTLMLTGVVSDEDRAIVTKWPIVGDLPIVGSFFRKTGKRKQKRQLIILITPKVLDDNISSFSSYRPIQ